MRIYFVRHGETEWNHLRKMQGQEDIPLNEKGIELAELTAEGMKEIRFDRVFSSPLVRASRTAEILAARSGVEVETDDRLKEISFGAGEGSNINEAKADPEHPMHNFFVHPDQFVPVEGGETFQQAQARGLEFVREVVMPLEKDTETVAVVAHAAMIRSLMVAFLDRPWREFWSGVYYKNCCVCIVDCIDGQLSVIEEAKVYY